MSARRGRNRGESDLFAEANVGALTLQETDASVFGFDRVDAGKIVAKPINIHEITPDPLQPRRTLPTSIRPSWDGTAATLPQVFAMWQQLAEGERGKPMLIDRFFGMAEETERPRPSGPIEESFIEIIDLAANIRANGLTNPITIVRTPGGFRLETGERRWMAYHFLFHYFDDEQEQWGRIPARIMDAFSVWRQAGENNARENLSAIARARQLAILLMEIYQRLGRSFQPYEALVGEGDCDRLFYAQVADGNAFPIPRGYGEPLYSALGFKQSSQFREHRSLLTLPDVVWQAADDLGWPHGRLRTLQVRFKDQPNQLITAVSKLAQSEGYFFIPSLPDSPPLPLHPADMPSHFLTTEDHFRRMKRMREFAKRVGQGRTDFSQRDLLEIKLMRDWLSELERQMKSVMQK